MVFIIEEKYEDNATLATLIVQSSIKVNLMQWNTRLMAEFLRRKCFFR